MELAIYLQERVKNFSRYNKYSIGSDLRAIMLCLWMKVQWGSILWRDTWFPSTVLLALHSK